MQKNDNTLYTFSSWLALGNQQQQNTTLQSEHFQNPIDHRYVPFVVNTSRSFPHSLLITTRWVQLVEQELLPFRSTWVHSRFLMGFCYLICRFMCCRSLFVLSSCFLLAIVFSVLLRFTDSDYSFGIFKLFLENVQDLFDKI